MNSYTLTITETVRTWILDALEGRSPIGPVTRWLNGLNPDTPESSRGLAKAILCLLYDEEVRELANDARDELARAILEKVVPSAERAYEFLTRWVSDSVDASPRVRFDHLAMEIPLVSEHAEPWGSIGTMAHKAMRADVTKELDISKDELEYIFDHKDEYAGALEQFVQTHLGLVTSTLSV